MSANLPDNISPAPLLHVQHEQDSELLQFCTFYLGDKKFGIDIIDIQEVSAVPEVTPTYHTPPRVAGLVNIRSEIFLCLDLRVIFGMPQIDITEESRLVIFKQDSNEDFGILVDRVDDILEVPEHQIELCSHSSIEENSAEFSQVSSHLIKSVSRLDDELLLIIDSSVLLSELDVAFDNMN